MRTFAANGRLGDAHVGGFARIEGVINVPPFVLEEFLEGVVEVHDKSSRYRV